MGDERALLAIGRIERALARIETAATSEGQRQNNEHERLREAHRALRARVESAITHIDRLLAPAAENIDGHD